MKALLFAKKDSLIFKWKQFNNFMMCVENIVKIITSNVSSNEGITNNLINKLCSKVCRYRFKGVFTIVNLPPFSILNNDHFTLIINIGAHFISIYSSPNFILYIDPFGLPCLNTQLKLFLLSANKKIFYNKKQIQNKKSQFCGIYAIFFCKYFDEERTQKYQFHPSKKSMKNDTLCIKYINKLL